MTFEKKNKSMKVASFKEQEGAEGEPDPRDGDFRVTLEPKKGEGKIYAVALGDYAADVSAIGINVPIVDC